MTLHEWRNNHDMVKATIAFLESDFGRMFMDCLKNNLPIKTYPINDALVPVHSICTKYGEEKGALYMLYVIEAMSKLDVKQQKIEPDYGIPFDTVPPKSHEYPDFSKQPTQQPKQG